MKNRKYNDRSFLLTCFFSLFCFLSFCTVPASGEEKSTDPLVSYDLNQCLDKALEKNFQILNAKEEIERQQGVYIETRGRLFPHISLRSSLDQTDESRIQTLNGESFGTEYNWSADIVLEQSIYSGGQRLAATARDQLRIEAAHAQLEAVINEVMFQVKQQYYAVLLARSQIKVNEQTVELLEEELESAKNKRDVGSISDFNVLRAEVELANSRAPLIRANNYYRLALEELSRLLGMTSLEKGEANREPLIVLGELSFTPVELSLTSALEKAFSNRPELKRFESLVEAEKKGVRAAKAGYLPDVAGYVSYGADKSQFSSDFQDNVEGWRAGVQGTWSIFDSFETAGRVKQARSNETLAKLTQAQTKLDIDVELRRAYSLFIEARELVNASRKVVEQAEESQRLARARLDAGTGIQLEVLDAQVALSDARSNEVRALYDYNVAIARMLKEMGVQSLS